VSSRVETAGAWGEEVTSSPSVPSRRRPRTEAAAPYLLLAPSVFFLGVFVVWPAIQAIHLAIEGPNNTLTSYNFYQMFHEYTFWPSVKNTLIFMVSIIPLEFCLAFSMALIINTGLRGQQFFLYVWTIPLAISDLAAGIVWLSIYTQNGYFNSILHDLGVSQYGYQFLSYQNTFSLFAVCVVAEIWRSTSLVMLILLGGLQGIPKEFGEAADVFGANFWQRLWHITLPLLKPSIRVALILRTIFAIQVFAVILALVGSNLPVLGAQAYNWYHSYQNPNIAAAYSIVILILSILTTTFYLTVIRSKSERAGAAR
jgi:multiple sugar transport system permease protein